MTIKILSDFDGVWTDPTHEAVAVEERFGDDLARRTGFARERVARDLAHCRMRALSEAERHGWTPGGRLTAYADEDPFLAVSGVASYLATASDPLAEPYRRALAQEAGADFMVLADRAFREVGAVPGLGRLLPEGAQVLAELEELGCDIVVVSNSDTSKLVRLFADAGIEAGTEPGVRVRVRGGARKWALGASDEHILVRGRRVHVDRPEYGRILAEEHPDLVVGDVFSLDLALPFHLRARGVAGAPRVLVHRPPSAPTDWVAGHAEHGHVDAVAPRLTDLVAIAARARRAE